MFGTGAVDQPHDPPGEVEMKQGGREHGRTGGQEDRRTGGQEDRRTGGQEDRRTGGQEDRRNDVVRNGGFNVGYAPDLGSD